MPSWTPYWTNCSSAEPPEIAQRMNTHIQIEATCLLPAQPPTCSRSFHIGMRRAIHPAQNAGVELLVFAGAWLIFFKSGDEFCGVFCSFPVIRTHLGCPRQATNATPGPDWRSRTTRRVEPYSWPGPCAGLAVAKEVLHHMERMLDLGPDTGLGVFDPLHQIPKGALPSRLCACWGAGLLAKSPEVRGSLRASRPPGIRHPRTHRSPRRAGAPGPDDMGGGTHHVVHRAGLGIDGDMGLHAEIPLAPFLCLVHLLAPPPPFPVLDLGRRSDQGGIDNRAFPQQQAPLRQIGIDGSEDGFGQPMPVTSAVS